MSVTLRVLQDILYFFTNTHLLKSISKARFETVFTYSRLGTKWAFDLICRPGKLKFLIFGRKPQSKSVNTTAVFFQKNLSWPTDEVKGPFCTIQGGTLIKGGHYSRGDTID